MGDNNNDDGFMLNMNLFDAPNRSNKSVQQLSKKQQRPRSWNDKKDSKKNHQQGRGPRSGAGRSISPPPPLPSLQNNLLKGYALDLPSPSKPKQSPASTKQREYDHDAPSPAATNKILSPEEGGNTRNRDQPRKRSRNTLQTSAPHQQQTGPKVVHEKPSKRIGRIRLASRMAGDREATPDQDDILPIQEDDEQLDDEQQGEKRTDGDHGADDIMAAVVAAAVARDKLIEKELAVVNAERRKQGIPTADEYHSSDDDAEDVENDGKGDDIRKDIKTNNGDDRSGSGYPGGGVFTSGANNMPLGERPKDEDGNDIIVDFDYGGSAYPELHEKAKKKRARWESIGGPVPAVKPGMLTHTGGGGTGGGGNANANAAAIEEMFHVGVVDGNNNSSDSDDEMADKAALTKKNKPNTKKSSSQADGGVSGSGPPTFETLGLCSALATHLETLGFQTPTAVQQQTIPVVLQGKDALVNAPTGSGKTLSYLAPIMHDLSLIEPRISRSDGTLALIICPTRELCLQVVDTLTLLSRRFFWIVPGSVHGGENRAKEKARLRKGVSVLVTTPGRLLDHLENTESFRIDQLKWLVLDEADRLLDLGFEKKIAQILKVIDDKSILAQKSSNNAANIAPIRRKTILLSATLHGGLSGLAGLSLYQPEAIGWNMKIDKNTGKIKILSGNNDDADLGIGEDGDISGSTGRGGGYAIPKQLKQQYVQIPCKLRLVALAAMIRLKIITGHGGASNGKSSASKAKVVVFFSNCDSVEFHHAVLSSGAWAAASGQALLPHSAPLLKLHGNMPQAERTSSLISFTKAEAGVLLCTDVAARGLDFPAVTAIIQFDPPGTAEEYVHRVGRTARLGQSGEALLIIQPSEKGYIDHLRGQKVNLGEESATTALDRTLGMDPKAGKGLPIERHHGAYRLQKEVMDAVDSDPHLKNLAETAFRSSVRAYATHSAELKPYFNVKTLHIGHLAHSFALKASPAMVGKSSTGEEAKRRREEDFRKGRGGGGKKFKQQQQQQQQQSPGKGKGDRKAGPGGKYQGFTSVKSGKGGYVLS